MADTDNQSTIFILSALRQVSAMDSILWLLTWQQYSPKNNGSFSQWSCSLRLVILVDKSTKLQYWQKLVVSNQILQI